MKKVATFEKVSFEEFKKGFTVDNKEVEDHLRQVYDDIVIPKRATAGSAGYDFSSPFHFKLFPTDEIIIPTGIRVKFEEPGWSLDMYPRSGLGFKYSVRLANTVGIIDSDYYYGKNEGHIMLKIVNGSYDEDKVLEVDAGDRIAQGIFHEYGIVTNDDAKGERIGGMGSTGN